MTKPIKHSFPPRCLDKCTPYGEDQREAELLEAIRLARVQLGEKHPLVKAALRSMRSKERMRRQVAQVAPDDLSAEVFKRVAREFPPVEERTRSAQQAYGWRKKNPAKVRA
jgi:hypothetical protein